MRCHSTLDCLTQFVRAASTPHTDVRGQRQLQASGKRRAADRDHHWLWAAAAPHAVGVHLALQEWGQALREDAPYGAARGRGMTWWTHWWNCAKANLELCDELK